MKEKDAKVDGGHDVVMYVQKEDATYGPVQTGSYMAKNYLDDLHAKQRHFREEALQRLRKGEISPVGYYMALMEMAEADLALRVGVSRRKVRRHMTPKGFARIGLPLLARYAEVFGVPAANLLQVIVPGEGVGVRHEATGCPPVVVTRIDKGAG